MSTFPIQPIPNEFHVVHPLDDVAEKKCDAQGLGPIRMTPAVKLSLRILRGYLVLMTLMLAYHVLDLAHLVPKLR